MPKLKVLRLLICCMLLFCAVAFAQTPNPCAYGSTKLICTVPNVFGVNGLGSPGPLKPVFGHDVHFDADFTTSFTALNTAIGTQLSLLQLASPASGFTFTFDRSLGIVQQTNESFGPVLSERAETIGRHKLFVATTYQFIPFNSLNGISLKHIPVVFQHIDTPNNVTGLCINGLSSPGFCNPVPVVLGSNGQPTLANNGNPDFERDLITTDNRVDLKVHQVTLFATFGLTSRIDVSVAVPISNVRLGVSSNATVQPIGNTTPFVHLFDCTNFQSLCLPATDPKIPAGVTLVSLTRPFSNARSVTGLGDVTFRVKGTIFRGERAALALGADVRTPTGDEQNLLGSGAFGFKPFLAASYRARVSPHANIGFQWNGDSILAGDVSAGTKARLPRQFFYSAGVDAAITRRLTIAADLLGSRVFNTSSLAPVTFTGQINPTTGTQSTFPDSFQINQSFNIDDGSIGLKYSPFGRLLITANVQFKLNEGGLRSNVSPLVGLSYTF